MDGIVTFVSGMIAGILLTIFILAVYTLGSAKPCLECGKKERGR